MRSIYKIFVGQRGGGDERRDHLGLEYTNFPKLKGPPENSIRQNVEGK